MNIVSDVARSDTIDARLSAPLVMHIRGPDGELDHPVKVSIAGFPAAHGDTLAAMRVIDATGIVDSTAISTTGDFTIRVVFGRVAGPAALQIKVPELGLMESIAFTVLPGKPRYMILSPADTAIVLGRSYVLSGKLIDDAGNRLDLPVSFFTLDAGVTLEPNGKVTGTTFARASIDGYYATFRETAMVSVIPAGRIALTGSSVLILEDTDGGNVKSFPTGAVNVRGLSWSADKSRLFLPLTSPPGGPIERIMSLSATTGEISKLIADTVTALQNLTLIWPSATRDGEWVYFVAIDDNGGAIWRVRPDGTGAQELIPAPSELPYLARSSPSVSRDGTRIAFLTNAVPQILDLQSGSITSVPGGLGDVVKWSPVADVLAVLNNRELFVINPDGTNRRQLLNDLTGSYALDWSPDGVWLIAEGTLVNVQTGLVLPLRTGLGINVAWKPN